MDGALDVIRPEVDLDPGRARPQAALEVTAGPVGDDGAQLVVGDRELRRIDDPAIAQALQPGVLDVEHGRRVERIGHPGLADVDLAVDAAVGSVGIEDGHAAILCPRFA